MMTVDDPAARLATGLQVSFPDASVTVIPDVFSGYRIEIVSSSFSDLSLGERRRRVLEHVQDRDVALLRLLAPDEVEEGFTALGDQLTDLPLWPEALAHGQQEEIQVWFPSLQYHMLPAPVVATFYSLRGGVGRSTALAHTAYLLAEQGLSVLCIDMDLEAPGLAALFGVADQVVADRGVVSLLARLDIGEKVPDLSPHIIRVAEDVNLSLLPAGKPSPAYAQDLSLLDPGAWYREEFNPLRELILAIKSLELAVRPDVILIDSRTGISPIAAPLLFDVADLAIVTFFPHPQAKEGTGLLTRALLAASTERVDPQTGHRSTPEPRFLVSPVPATPESYSAASQRAQDWIAEWLSPARTPAGKPAFEAIEDIIHVVGYQEAIATSDRVAGTVSNDLYEPVAAWIAGLVDSDVDSEVGVSTGGAGEPSKSQVLGTLEFVGETAEQQPIDTLKEIFVDTEAVSVALQESTPLVIGRKGTGKTFIFRQLATQSNAIPITSAPGVDEASQPWTPNADLYKAIAGTLAERGLEWRHAWMALIALIVTRARNLDVFPDRLGLQASQSSLYGVSGLLADVRTLLSEPDGGIALRGWLTEIDGGVQRDALLLFDGLDTGFGRDNVLRDEAVAGLLLVTNDLGLAFTRLRMKVFIREDIWRSVAIPNKSHLRARASLLQWNDKTDYLRIAIRQAWRSSEFRALVRARLTASVGSSTRERSFDVNTEIEYWPDAMIRRSWQLLVGERVAGGKTAFTDNWAWARLADGNGDHSPRLLVQLLEEATKKERVLERGSPFGRSIIRPRALVEALDQVSERALDAFRSEEFSELEPVLQILESIGETPFDESRLAKAPAALVALAEEVGLLEASALPREVNRRYRVPEIYRKALGMSRRGQQ